MLTDLLRSLADVVVRMPDPASPEAQALIDIAIGMVDAVDAAPTGTRARGAA